MGERKDHEKSRHIAKLHTMAPTIKIEPFAEDSMSKTDQYRKVMKPLIERKRRARINNCLDELKDLMVYALQTEGESISKLEKADVLELTVKHLRKLKRQQMLSVNPDQSLTSAAQPSVET